MVRNAIMAAVMGLMGSMLPYTGGMSIIGRIATGFVVAAVAFVYIVGTDPMIGGKRKNGSNK